MALVNPNIAMSFRQPEIQAPNALAQFAQIQQIQGGRQAQELNALKMQEAQAAIEERNALANAYSQSIDSKTGKIDYNKLTGFLASGRGASQIPAIEKTRRDLENAAIEQQTKSTKLLADKLALLPEAYKRADTPEAYLQLHQSVHADPVIGPWLNSVGATPEKGLATLQNAVQTGKFDDLRLKSMQSVSQILDSMKPQVVAPGSTLVQGGKPVFTAPERQDTDLIRNFNAAVAQGFKGNLFDYERRIKEAGRTPAQPVAPSLTRIQDPTNPAQMIEIDARVYRGGGIGSPGVYGTTGKTAPAAAAEQKRIEGATQAQDILDTLRASYDELDRLRAVPSEQRGLLSNAVSYIAGTGVGQVAGRVAGTKEQTQRDVIASARNQMLNAIKNATGMSAQQLNSNVEFRSWLEALTDPTRSIEANRSILDNMEKFIASGGKYSTRKDGGQPAPAGGKPTPAATSSGATVSNW